MTHVFNVTMSGIMTSILIFLFFSSCISTIKGLIHKRINVNAVIAASMFTLMFFMLSGLLFFYYSITNLYGTPSLISKTAGGGCWILAQVSMTFAFISRISFIFKGTVLAISTSTKKTLYYSWILLILIGLSGLTIFEIYVYKPLLIPLATTWVLLYFTISVVLVVIFIQKLKVLAIKTTTQKTDISVTNTTATSINDSRPSLAALIDMDLFYIAVKNVLLVPMAIISSVSMVVITTLVMPQLGLQYDVAPFVGLDSTVSAFCLYLLFGANANIYNKVCRYPHNVCLKCQIHAMDTVGYPSNNETDGATVKSRIELGRMKLTNSQSVGILSVQYQRPAIQCQVTSLSNPIIQISSM